MLGIAGGGGAGCCSAGFAREVDGNRVPPGKGVDPGFNKDGAGSTGFAGVEPASCVCVDGTLGLGILVPPKREGVDEKVGAGC